MDFKKFAIASTLFAFLTTVAAQVYIPNGDVPITLQSVFVLLAGLIAGANAGMTSQFIYLMLGVFTPVYAGDTYGMDILADPSVGYLFGFPIAAFIAGLLGHKKNFWMIMLGVVLAQTALYVSGVLVLKINSETTFANAIQIGFVDLAFIGYGKAVVTGLLYYGYRRVSEKRVSEKK
jgi:biotin transport system substrate-specific component